MLDSMRIYFGAIRKRLFFRLGVAAGLAIAGSGVAFGGAGEAPDHPLDGPQTVTQYAQAPASPKPSGQSQETTLEHAAKHLDPTYVCPMHPQVVQKEPGSCPLCGMDLVSAEEAQKQMAAGPADGQADPHAQHRMMMSQTGYKRSEHDYRLPDLALVDKNGQKTSLLREVNVGKPVMLNFIFTTCTTICPVLSATFSQVKAQLGEDADQVRMVSVSIDPEHDTPERLQEYAERFNAGAQWQFLTGDMEEIVAVQKAFDAYRGSKMNHEPLTFLRIEQDDPWVRINGLASAADVVKEYRQLVAKQDSAQ